MSAILIPSNVALTYFACQRFITFYLQSLGFSHYYRLRAAISENLLNYEWGFGNLELISMAMWIRGLSVVAVNLLSIYTARC